MTHRMLVPGRAAWAAVVVFFSCAVTSAALAKGPSSLTISECAKASTIRSTIDPNKPDAAQKAREAERWQRRCKIAMARTAAAPPPERSAPPRPNGHTASRPSGLNLLNRLKRLRDQMPSGSRTEPRRAAAPPAAAPPAPPPRFAWRPAASVPAPAAVRLPAATPPASAPAPVAPAAAPSSGSMAAFLAPATPPAPASASTGQREVFDLRLGERLRLPACAPGVVQSKDARAFDANAKTQRLAVTESCAERGAAAQPTARRMADVGARALPSGVTYALARISPEHCPSWVSGSCTLSVALKDDVLLGVAFLTTEDSERTVSRILNRKYGPSTEPPEPASCRTEPGNAAARRDGNDRSWQLADLRVSYWSVGGLSCGQGRVLIETQALSQLLQEPPL